MEPILSSRNSLFRSRRVGAQALVLALVLALPDCHRERVLARQGDLLITGAYAHPSTGDAGAAYVRVRNAGSTADTLISASGPAPSSAMLMTTEAGQMRQQPMVVVPADGELDMRPGGVHVMFSGLTGEYRIGDTLRVSLTFARGGTVAIAAPVVPYGEMPE
jgi:periplasmic copper chaperone A